MLAECSDWEAEMTRGFVTEASIYHDTITPGLELIVQTSS